MDIVKDFSGKFTPGLKNNPLFIIVHDTASGNATLNSILRFFRLSKAVSVHYVVGKSGEIVNMVPEDKVAWHAGVSEYLGYKDLNRYSIGIEVLSDGNSYTDEQRVAVWELCRDIMARNAIPPFKVLRHADVAMPKGRKSDISSPFWHKWGNLWADFQTSLSRKEPWKIP